KIMAKPSKFYEQLRGR
nr:RecName: Full=Beta-basrubin [Basella alba]